MRVHGFCQPKAFVQFFQVGLEQGHALVRWEALEFRVHGHRNACVLTSRKQARNGVFGEQALVVVLKNHHVRAIGALKQRLECVQDVLSHFRGHVLGGLLVHANDVLASADDTGFHRGGTRRVHDQVRRTHVFQQGGQICARSVLANHADQRHFRPQGMQVFHHVARATCADFSTRHIHNGHRGLRADAAHTTPHVGVDHDVPHNTHLGEVPRKDVEGKGGIHLAHADKGRTLRQTRAGFLNP